MHMIWAAFNILTLAAVIADARTYRIPNWISIALATLFAAAVAASGEPVQSFWPHLALGLGVLALGYGLYALTGMGAGDAKLAAAIALWTGLPGLYMWTLMLGLAMGLLALALVVLRRALPAGAGERSRVFQKGAPVPLGIALGLSAIAASAWYDPALWSF
jgi:prepilin peptidase CpaA